MRTPKVRNNNGSCCIRFTTPDGNTHSLTQGRMDNPRDVARMQRIALEVYEHVLDGSFTGLDSYKQDKERLRWEHVLEAINASSSIHRQSLHKLIDPVVSKPVIQQVIQQMFNSSKVAVCTKKRYWVELRSIVPQLKRFTVLFERDKGVQSDREAFTDNEVKLIIESFNGSIWEDFTKVLFLTGMRPSEAMGLRHCDVDMTVPHIRIAESLQNGKRKATKTGKTRYFPISDPALLKLFNNLLNKTEIGLDGYPLPGSDELIFTNRDGNPITARSYRDAWEPRLTELGVRYRPPYTARHTFISHCLKHGVDVATVAKWVGNSPKVIWEHYASSIGEDAVPELY